VGQTHQLGPGARGGNPEEFSFSVRVRCVEKEESKVYDRKIKFSMGRQASFSDDDPYPSASEYLIAAVGGDLANGFQNLAARQGVTIDGIELVISSKIENPLTLIGVVGAKGRPRIQSISVIAYVSTDEAAKIVQKIWNATLDNSPILNTIRGSVQVTLDLRIMA
jgi:hypothetical protein